MRDCDWIWIEIGLIERLDMDGLFEIRYGMNERLKMD
jgi:hypothetical protein